MSILVGSIRLSHSNLKSIVFFRKDYLYRDLKVEYSVLSKKKLQLILHYSEQ